MSIDWESEAGAARDREVRARAAAHAEAGSAASLLQRSQGPAALRAEGESEYWALRAQVHEVRRSQLEVEADLEADVAAHASKQRPPQ
jgi:hypothetical protein